MAEAEARATEPASLPALVGGGAGLTEQTEAELDRAIRVLRVYLTEDRISRMKDVLDQRTKSATIVFENPCNPNNVSSLKHGMFLLCVDETLHAAERNPVSKHQIQPEYGDGQADAVRDCRTRPARPNSQARTRTGKYSFSLFS